MHGKVVPGFLLCRRLFLVADLNLDLTCSTPCYKKDVVKCCYIIVQSFHLITVWFPVCYRVCLSVCYHRMAPRTACHRATQLLTRLRVEAKAL